MNERIKFCPHGFEHLLRKVWAVPGTLLHLITLSSNSLGVPPVWIAAKISNIKNKKIKVLTEKYVSVNIKNKRIVILKKLFNIKNNKISVGDKASNIKNWRFD